MAEEDAREAGEDPVVTRARKRFEQAVEAEDENRTKQLDDMRFLASTPDDNFQWPTEILRMRQKPGEEGGIRPCLTINKMRPHQRQVTNEQRLNRPQITARPADSRASVEVAKVLNGWLRHVQVASEADLAYDIACDWQTGGGEGFFRMYTAYADEMSFEQEVVFEPCADRFKVYLDPIGLRLHPAGKKCKWGFIVEDLPKDEYEAEYGKENELDWNEAGAGDQKHWFPSGNTLVRVAEYFELEEKTKTICLWADGSVTVKGSPEERRYAGQKPEEERQTRIPRCIWRKMNGQKVLSTKEMPTKYVPIIRVVGNQWVLEGKLLVDGMVRPGKDAQRMYNYNASAEIEMNALQPKAPITAMIDQIKGHEDRYRNANTIPYSYLPYNPVYDENGQLVNVAPPSRVQPPVPPAAFIQAKIGADQDLKATMGQWGPALGEPSGEKSGKAINARKSESDVGSFHYVDNLARALRYAGAIALDMAAEIITTRRVVRILGEDGEPDHIVVDPDLPVPYQEEAGEDGKPVKVYNFGLGKYEVVVSTGPSFTTRRAEAAEFLTSAMQSAKDPVSANVLTYLAMKNQDVAGAEEAVAMLKRMLPPQVQEEEQQGGEQVPPQVKAMVDQLKQAVGHTQGQLDAAKQALAERDQKLQGLEAQAKSKDRESLAKMYEVDARTLAEIAKAASEVEIAKAQAIIAASKQPDNPALAGVVPALDQVLADLNGKIELLARSTVAIKSQLDNFEVAARMPQGAPAGQPIQ